MSKHTPGPWEADGEGYIFGPGTSMIAETRGWGDDSINEVANARLIAAAPDLLEACKLALNAFEKNHCIDWNDLSRAIAKAEGGTDA